MEVVALSLYQLCKKVFEIWECNLLLWRLNGNPFVVHIHIVLMYCLFTMKLIYTRLEEIVLLELSTVLG